MPAPKRSTLTASEFTRKLERLGLSMAEFSRCCGRSYGMIKGYKEGKIIPLAIERFLGEMEGRMVYEIQATVLCMVIQDREVRTDRVATTLHAPPALVEEVCAGLAKRGMLGEGGE